MLANYYMAISFHKKEPEEENVVVEVVFNSANTSPGCKMILPSIFMVVVSG